MRPLPCHFVALAIAALLVSAAPLAGAQDHLAAAKDLFRKGSEHYAAGRTGEAVEALRASLALYASPNTRLLLARSLRKQERYAEAALEYERTVRDAEDPSRGAGRYTAAAEAGRAELASLEPRIGRVDVVLRGDARGARVWVEGRDLDGEARSHPVPAMPGRLEVRASVGSVEARATALVVAGETTTVVLELAPSPSSASHGASAAPNPTTARVVSAPAPAGDAPPRAAPEASAPDPAPAAHRDADEPSADEPTRSPSWLGTAAWVSVGVGAVGVATFAGLFAATDARYGELVRTCVDVPCSEARYDELRGGGETLQTLANTALVVSAVGVAAGATFFYWDFRSRRVEISTFGTGASLRGSF